MLPGVLPSSGSDQQSDVLIQTKGGSILVPGHLRSRLLGLLDKARVTQVGVNLERNDDHEDGPLVLIGLRMNLGRSQRWVEVREPTIEACIKACEKITCIKPGSQQERALLRTRTQSVSQQ